MMRKLALLLFFNSLLICSQEQSIDQFAIDISELTVSELDNLTVDLEIKFDTVKAIMASKKLVLKSKLEDDFEYAARGFYSLSILQKDREQREIYSDSMLFFSKLSKEKYLLTDSYYLKANIEYYRGNYEKAMEFLAQAYKWAVLDENEEDQLHVATRMASIKNVLERYHEAHTIYKDAYDSYNDVDFNDLSQKQYYLDIVYNLTLTFSYLKQYDSTLHYAKKGKHLLTFYKSEKDHNKFTRSEAIGNLGKGQLDTAIGMFEKTMTGISSHDLAHSYYYLGRAYKLKGMHEKAILNFRKSDSVLQISKASAFPELKNAYKESHLYYAAKGDSLKAKTYLQKYFDLDNSLFKRKSAISERLHNLYSLPRLKLENENIVRRKKKNMLVVAILIFVCLMAFVFILLQKKQVKSQKKLIKELLAKNNTKVFEETITSKTIESSENNYGIKDDVKHQLLLQLEDFEMNKDYVNGSITLSGLAKDLNTNSSYLSSIINTNKGMNFATYLKTLRINNATDILMNNPIYQKYSMNGLAEEFGFNNADSFSKAFKEITKIKPSLFIKELSKTKNVP